MYLIGYEEVSVDLKLFSERRHDGFVTYQIQRLEGSGKQNEMVVDSPIVSLSFAERERRLVSMGMYLKRYQCCFAVIVVPMDIPVIDR